MLYYIYLQTVNDTKCVIPVLFGNGSSNKKHEAYYIIYIFSKLSAQVNTFSTSHRGKIKTLPV